MYNKLPLCFSNSILVHYLSFIRNEQGQEGVEKLLKRFGKARSWVENSSLWHNADDHELFLNSFSEVYGKLSDFSYVVAKSAFLEKKYQIFTSMIGLLLSPEKLFKQLPEAIKRMNQYNEYSFTMEKDTLAIGRGRLIQTYGDIKRTKLNSFLCSASRGSIEGSLKFFGYKIVELNETHCVKKGHLRCEYQIGWIKTVNLIKSLQFIFLFFTLFILNYYFINNILFYKILLSLTGSTLVIVTVSYFLKKKQFNDIYAFQKTLYEDQKEIAEKIESLNKKILDYQLKITEALELATLSENSFNFLKEATPIIQLLRHYSNELNSEIIIGYSKPDKMITCINAIDRAAAKIENLINTYRIKIRPLDGPSSKPIFEGNEPVC